MCLTLHLILACLLPTAYGIINFADITCGQSFVKANARVRGSRIVGGTEAVQGQFPWIVSLQYATGDNLPSHFCGGSLINKKYIITAAHCLQSIARSRFHVVLGEHVIGEEESPLNAFGVAVEEILVHPSFTPDDTTRNDIALLRLKRAIDWNPYVQPACLPNSSDSTQVGELTAVAGWGYTTDAPDISKTLMTVEVPVVSQAKCEEEYEWTGHDSQLCAGSRLVTKGGCKGDSGSPLMSKETLSVIGIHAGGYGCGVGMLPGIYTRVASYVDWIRFNIRP